MSGLKTILTTLVGSTLHGTSVEDGLEDLDLMSVMLEPLSHFVGFRVGSHNELIGFSNTHTWVHRTKPEGVRSEAGDVDHTKYSLKQYLNHAFKSNPTILLPLFAPRESVYEITKEGEELRSRITQLLVSQKAYNSFRGYLKQQFERLVGSRGQRNVTRPELVDRYGFDTKYAGHILRLGYQGEELLRTGRITLPMPESQRLEVVKMRTGGYSFEQACEMLQRFDSILDEARRRSTLRTEPDYRAVNAWMIRTYQNFWREGIVLRRDELPPMRREEADKASAS